MTEERGQFTVGMIVLPSKFAIERKIFGDKMRKRKMVVVGGSVNDNCVRVVRVGNSPKSVMYVHKYFLTFTGEMA